MKTNYKYIKFVKIEGNHKYSTWSCRNKKSNEALGVIEWYSPWKLYCYFPTMQAVYSGSCLEDIFDFIDGLKNEIASSQGSSQ